MELQFVRRRLAISSKSSRPLRQIRDDAQSSTHRKHYLYLTGGFKKLDISRLSEVIERLLECEDETFRSNLESVQSFLSAFFQDASDVKSLTDLVASIGKMDGSNAAWLLPQMLGCLQPEIQTLVLRGAVGLLAYQESPELVSRIWDKLHAFSPTAAVPVADICAVLDHLTLKGDEYLAQGLSVLSVLRIPNSDRKKVLDSLYRALKHTRKKRQVIDTVVQLGLLDAARSHWVSTGLTTREEQLLQTASESKKTGRRASGA